MFIRNAFAVAALVVAVSTAGCSVPAAERTDVGFRDQIQAGLDLARSNGGSTNQIAVLEDALAAGDITYAQIQSLFEELNTCFDDSGWGYTVLSAVETFPGSGVMLPNYVAFPPAGMDESSANALFDSCNNETVACALGAYSSPPAAVEAMMKHWDTPEVRSCLEARGFDVAEDALAHMDEPGFTKCRPGRP